MQVYASLPTTNGDTLSHGAPKLKASQHIYHTEWNGPEKVLHKYATVQTEEKDSISWVINSAPKYMVASP